MSIDVYGIIKKRLPEYDDELSQIIERVNQLTDRLRELEDHITTTS